MTVRLSRGSPHAPAAALLGAELVRAMSERGVGQRVVAEAAGVSRASVVEFRHGRNLPTVPVARRIAEALGWPRIASIVEEARRRTCATCGASFTQDTGRPRRFCSIPCRRVSVAMGRGAPDGTAQARSMLLGEVLRSGPARKQVIGRAVTLIEESRSAEIANAAAVVTLRDAVRAMCLACEPAGYCHVAACELRPASPLPLADGPDPVVTTAVPAAGMTHDAAWREAMSDANARRWAREGERERMGALSRDRWDAKGPEGREAWAMAVSEGRRRRGEAS